MGINVKLLFGPKNLT